MSFMKVEFNVKLAILVVLMGILTACATQTTQTPAAASQPTEAAVSTTDASAATATTIAQATEPATAAGVSFTDDILPILESRCVNCHGGDKLEKGLSVRTYGDLMSGSENGPVVLAGDAAHSKLVELIANQKMPKRGPKLTPPQLQLIVDWVNQGAQDN
jgi:mono/diheme cytochrome c family protein